MLLSSPAAPARSRRIHRLAGLALAVFLTASLAACSGSSGPTAPTPPPAVTGLTVATSLGSMPVVDHGCGDTLDLNRIGREIDTTAMIAQRQDQSLANPALLQGFEVHARPASEARSRCGGNAACFEPMADRGRLHVRCDGGGVEHETAHAVGWAGDLSCWESVYHSRNFRCERTDNVYGS